MTGWKLNSMRGTRSNIWTTQPQGGGMKKSGLAPSNLGSSGIGLMHGRTYLGGPRGVQANYRNKNIVFCINQIGGIGHTVGGRPVWNLMDGLNCQDDPGYGNDPNYEDEGGGTGNVNEGYGQ